MPALITNRVLAAGLGDLGSRSGPWLRCRTLVTRGLSYVEHGSRSRKEPLPATPFMAGSGGGWIVKGLVFKDRQ